MKYILLFVLTTFINVTYGQTDTIKNYSNNQLKKGFYKSFQEFANNAPSIIVDFTVEQQLRSEKDSTIISAAYNLMDKTKHIHNIWGFCDGYVIYVNYDNSASKKRCWKLDSFGPYKFFTYSYKSGVGLGFFSPENLLITALTSASHFINPAQCHIMVIDLKGNFKYPDHEFLIKLLSSQPDLKSAFEEEWVKYEEFDYATDEIEPDESKEGKMKVIKRYLTKLNERLTKTE